MQGFCMFGGFSVEFQFRCDGVVEDEDIFVRP